jgi:CHAT domain-containing protein
MASRLAWTGLLAVLASTAGGPAHAVTPQDVCGRLDAPGAFDAAALTAATSRAEAILSGSKRGAALDEVVSVLELPKRNARPSADEAAAELALARYCSVAGEAMRVSLMGSDRRASAYLRTALRHADAGGSRDLAARIAYRLALAVNQKTANPDTRSAKRRMRAAFEPSVELPTAAPAFSQACGEVFAPAFGEFSTWYAAQASLDCAVANADATGAHELAALSRLQIARTTLVEAERRPTSRAALRDYGGAAAVAGIADAAAMAEGAMRRTLLARLVEAAIDAGKGTATDVVQGAALLRSIPSEDPRERAILFALEGRIEAAAGRMAEAATRYRQAIWFESRSPQPLRLADWYLLLAEAEPDARQAHVAEAYRALEAVRTLLPISDPITEESTFRLRMEPVFRAAVVAQLDAAMAGNGEDRIRAAQEIVEDFRQAEIQSAFGRDCVPARRPIDAGELADNEILLYPILLEDRIELLAASGATRRYERLKPAANATREEVAALVRQMTYSLGYDFDASWKPAADRLWQVLIAPVADRLGPETTLVIVPDGLLRMLPFAALRDPQGRFLMQRTRLSVAPALAYAQPGAPIDREPTVVAAAVGKDVELPSGSFPALSGTAIEAGVASGEGEKAAPRGLLLENFARADLRQALASRQVDILHLATHAAFNGRSERSFIVAGDGAILLSDLRAMIEANRARGDELSLIVLSACETAVGDDQASMGLAGTAVQAGAESALASLWQVNDAGTVELMRSFYDHLRQGEARAEALRSAQLAMIAKGGDFGDPGVWAAFTLLGGWR